MSNGALSYDANKGVSWIDYDKLGNPIRVQFTDHSITEHVYAADGRRLKTIHRTSIPQSNPLGIGVTASLTPAQTQSIDSLDYVGNFIYEKGALKRYMFDDGYLKLYTNTFSPRFFIKDHLGNNRILTDGSGNIKQNTNYYPYGGMTSISTGQGEQQFKYNGKEYDPMHGLNEYDYGARQYDPAISKFTTMDPLCEKYYHISPYAYCGGNPVNAVDPDGRYIAWIDENLKEWKYDIDQHKFMNNGNVYSGDNPFVGTLESLINELLSKADGRKLVETLIRSKEGVGICQHNRRSYECANELTDPDELLFNPEIKSFICLCLEQEVDGFNKNYTTLAHELAHAQDRISGNMDNSEWISDNVSKSEIYACHIENLVRAEHNLPLREFYITDSREGRIYEDIKGALTSLYFIEKYNHSMNYVPIRNGNKRYVYKYRQ